MSKRDKLNIHDTKQDAIQMLDDILNLNELQCRDKYSIPDDVRDWNFSLARKDIKEFNKNPEFVKQINYRPFDKRYFCYTGKSKGVVGCPVPVVAEHLLHSDNFGFMTNKKVEKFTHCIIYKGIVESHTGRKVVRSNVQRKRTEMHPYALSPYLRMQIFILFLYSHSGDQAL